jgi:DNA-binding response OmpR family regulator
MSKKILVIEDDPSSLRLIKYTLQQEGYQVLIAPNGLEGLRKAKNEEPDLIILDVLLPGIDGYEICHRLRAESQTAQLPILMVSGKARDIDKATGLKMGADDYITKPWHRPELLTKIAVMLQRNSVALNSNSRRGDSDG